MAKKYVPAGVFLTCDKGTLPTTLNVVFNARTVFHGQNVATDLDMLPTTNVPPMGVCSVSKGPCLLVPAGKWSPVKDDVQLGSGHPLLEDSQLRCGLTGCISIHFSLADAQAACPPPPAPEGSVFDQMDERLQAMGPLGAYGRFQLGVAEGVWEGGKGLAEGLWGLAKGGWDAVTHPVETAKAIGDGVSSAYQWAGDGQNWANAAHSAGQGLSDAATWAGNGDNWHHVGEQLGSMSPRDWGKITGRVGFEVGLTAATAGAGTALVAAAETSRLARAALLVARAADVEGLALRATGSLARTAAGQLRVLGKFVTGARRARRLTEAARDARAALRASPLGQKLKAVAAWVERKRKCLRDPVDVADGVMLFGQLDLELPGPIPFIWERKWYSNSTYQGPLGAGWHHPYDAALLADAETVAVRLGDGRLALFAQPDASTGYRVLNRLERLELTLNQTGYRVFSFDERRTYCFAPLAAAHELHVLRRIEDANGFHISLSYDAQGHLRTITDSAGRQVRLQLDDYGRIAAIEAPDPSGAGYFAVMRYRYDAEGNLTAVTDALGSTMRYAYQGHLLVQKTSATGVSFYFEYDGPDATARCVHTWGDGGLLNGRFSYEPGRTTVTSTTPGDVSVYEHTDGLVTRHLNPLGATHEWAYDAHGDLLAERDPLSRITSYAYDTRGNQTQITYPDGVKVGTSYNAQNLPVQAVDANGGTWHWTYNEAGQLLERTDPTTATVRYGYDAQARLTAVTNAAGQATRLRYDQHHNISRLTTPEGQATLYQYNALGQLTSLTDARGNVQHRAYDIIGRVTAVREANSGTTTFSYDCVDNLVRMQDAQRTVELTYNELGQITSRTEAGARTQLTYDLQGRLSTLTNEQGQAYTFILDAAGQVLEEVGFDGLTRRFQRDAAGQLLAVQRPAGLFTSYAYDAAGRVTEVLHNGAERTTYRYRADGALAEASSPDATVLFERDALGRVLRETQNGHLVESTHNVLGQRVHLHSSLGAEMRIERDAMGRVRRTQAGAWQNAIERDAQGLELFRQVSGGIKIQWQYDTWGRPASQAVSVGSQSSRRSYRWQGASRLHELIDSTYGTTSFAYDAHHNLTATTYPDGSQELRPPAATGSGLHTPTGAGRVVGAAGQLLESNGTRYHYDAEGNLTRKVLPDGQRWLYAWDGAGQLTTVTQPSGHTVAFAYDALGRRVSKRYRGKVTRWVWDGNKPLHEWHELEVGPGAGSLVDLVTWLFDEASLVPAAKLTAQQAYSVITDHLGTPVALYNEQGTKTWQAQLNSYGAVREGRGQAQDCPFRYQGQYEDVETGLYYNRFRYYDPELGQYISQDPIRLTGGTQFYAYVGNPTCFIDPFGLSPVYGPLDALGRPTSVYSEITLADLRPTASSKPTLDPPGWLGGAHPNHQQRSHLLGDTLGGSGSDARNLVTLTDGSNHPAMSKIEGRVRKHIRNNPTETVYYESRAHYNGSNPLPEKVSIFALDHNGNVLENHVIPNGLRQKQTCCRLPTP